MNKFEIPLLISSDENAGAFNKSSDGSTFDIILNPPIQIPNNAKECIVSVQESTVWWTVPNILVGENDQFAINDGVIGLTTITIPQGLYDLTSLNSKINELLVNEGFESNLITLIPDTATSKVVISANAANVTIDNTIANCVSTSLMGFNSSVLGPTFNDLTFFTSDNIANFNTIDSFTIISDICDSGIRLNNKFSNIISTVLIDVRPGSQIVSRPFLPPKVGCNKLIGGYKTRLNFRLADQNGNAVNTNGENWTARLNLTYFI